MEIKYFNDATGQRIESFRVTGFKYLRNQTFPKKFYENAVEVFLNDLRSFRNNPLSPAWNFIDRESFGNFGTGYFNITKLPKLYDVLKLGNKFNNPFMVRDNVQVGGHGRSLIAGRYFPDRKYDIVYHTDEVGGEELVWKYLDELFQFQWQNVVVCLDHIRDDIYQIRGAEFVSDDRFDRPIKRGIDTFLEDLSAESDWKKMRQYILTWKGDDLHLLDKIVDNDLL